MFSFFFKVETAYFLPKELHSHAIFFLDRYAYSGDASEEFDKDDTNLTLIKPAPLPSKDVRSVPEARPLQGGNGVPNGDMEEEKTE